MKCNLSSIFLFFTPLLLALSAEPCHAQDKYFRYFVVETKTLRSDDLADISARLARNEFMSVYSSCPEKMSLVLQVDAAYPKRIEEVKNEITSIIASTLKARNVLSVKDIPLAERNQTCP